MTIITLPRTTVEQALGAMNEAVFSLYSPYTSETPEEKALYETIAAFRAALEQQAKAGQDQRCRAEPRSDGDFVCDCKIGECPSRSAAPPQQAEPVEPQGQLAALQAMLRAEVDRLVAAGVQPQRKPLTEEEIIDAVRDADLDWAKGWTLDEMQGNRFATLARAVERAHGIGEGA